MVQARTILSVAAIALLLGDGVFALFLTATTAPRPATLTIEGAFPDYDGGRLGSNPSNRVAFAFEIATMLPWYRGQVQALSVALTAQQGPTVFEIGPDVAPGGGAALMTGGRGIALMVASSRRGRRPALWRVSFPRASCDHRSEKTNQRGSKYDRWIARRAPASTRNRTNPAMTAAVGSCVTSTSTIGPNPTTDASATGQAHN